MREASLKLHETFRVNVDKVITIIAFYRFLVSHSSDARIAKIDVVFYSTQLSIEKLMSQSHLVLLRKNEMEYQEKSSRFAFSTFSA